MNNNDSEFTNLTRAQVGALQECFDFLRNGYVQVSDFYFDGKWVIRMRHQQKFAWLTITIKPYQYAIRKNGAKVKEVFFRFNHARFAMSVDSDLNVTVTKMSRDANKKLVSG